MTEHDSSDADATLASPRRSTDLPAGAGPPPQSSSDENPTLANRWPREGAWEKPVSPTSLLNEQNAQLCRAGRYRIVGEIGRGGMGVVLRGHDPDLGRDLAIKVQLSKANTDVHRRFLEEARIAGRLQHPGVVHVHEVGRLDDGAPFFAM
jgi:serine/threonine-protein kinase